MKGSSHDLLRWQRLQAAFTSEASTCKMIVLYSALFYLALIFRCFKLQKTETETSWTVWSSWIFLFKVTVRCLGLGTRSDAPKALRVVRKHRRWNPPGMPWWLFPSAFPSAWSSWMWMECHPRHPKSPKWDWFETTKVGIPSGKHTKSELEHHLKITMCS